MSDYKEQAIFKAAQEVFAEKGFERATMDEIALKAKVAKGTLFYRFKSKDELFLSLIRSALEKLIAELRRVIAQSDNTFDKIGKVIEIQTRESFQNPHFIKMILSEGWGTHTRQQQLRVCLKDYLNLLQEIIEEGIRKGSLRKVNSSILATSMFGMIASASFHLLIVKDAFQIDQTIEELKAFCFKGISPVSD